DGQAHIIAGDYANMRGVVLFIERGIRSFDGERAALFHGVASVDGKVHQDLVDLSGVGGNVPQAGFQNDAKVDIFTEQAAEHFLDVGYALVEIEHLRLNHLMAAEGQQLPGEIGR